MTADLTPAQLQEARAVIARTTPGPLVASSGRVCMPSGNGVRCGSRIHLDGDVEHLGAITDFFDRDASEPEESYPIGPNAARLCLSWNLLPALLDRCEALERYVKWWHDRFDEMEKAAAARLAERDAARAEVERLRALVDPIHLRPKYDAQFGDDRECECGHAYYRHFDGYEDNAPVGCKYCDCETWKEPK